MSTNQYNFNPSQYYMSGQRNPTFWDWLLGNKANVENLNRQIQNYNYQVDLQSLLFQREDNAVYRKMQDLINSGLNPALATNSGAAAGSVVATSTPQQNFNEFPNILSTASDLVTNVSSAAQNFSDLVTKERLRENQLIQSDLQTFENRVTALTGLKPGDALYPLISFGFMHGDITEDNYYDVLKKHINELPQHIGELFTQDVGKYDEMGNQYFISPTTGERMYYTDGIAVDNLWHLLKNSWRDQSHKLLPSFNIYNSGGRW